MTGELSVNTCCREVSIRYLPAARDRKWGIEICCYSSLLLLILICHFSPAIYFFLFTIYFLSFSLFLYLSFLFFMLFLLFHSQHLHHINISLFYWYAALIKFHLYCAFLYCIYQYRGAASVMLSVASGSLICCSTVTEKFMPLLLGMIIRTAPTNENQSNNNWESLIRYVIQKEYECTNWHGTSQ